jgi:uncharacterized membrane-anchored protein YhcB (DUF1043 family)
VRAMKQAALGFVAGCFAAALMMRFALGDLRERELECARASVDREIWRRTAEKHAANVASMRSALDDAEKTLDQVRATSIELVQEAARACRR